MEIYRLAAQRLALPAGVSRQARQPGRTRQRSFARTNLEPRKLPENAPTPTTPAPALFAGVRVHALLACLHYIASSLRQVTKMLIILLNLLRFLSNNGASVHHVENLKII